MREAGAGQGTLSTGTALAALPGRGCDVDPIPHAEQCL
jgi:hypothetical protein